MKQVGAVGWFALHEARLAWRDWVSLMTGGSRRRAIVLALGAAGLVVFLHGLAYLMLASSPHLAARADRQVLVIISVTLLMSWSMMLSQALEAVTRVFYARGDLDLILSSPSAVGRLFAVRIAAMTGTIMLIALVLAAPFINVLAWLGGVRWLGAYAAVLALAMGAAAVALVLCVALLRTIGAARTRGVAQVAAAVVGAAFAIVVQFAAIVSYGAIALTLPSRIAVLVERAPHESSVLWWPARAIQGEPMALTALFAACALALAGVTYLVSPRFGEFVLAAGGAVPPARQGQRRPWRLRARSPSQALRRKEWVLLLRDPWLISQALMQLLYLLPAAFLLWRSLYSGAGAPALLVPILIVAAGQLGGGLSWLAVSGEDAPELIASAPVAASLVLRAKAEAVLGAIAVIFAPLLAMLAVAAPFAALVALGGIALAAVSATAIQFWFRAQARRSLFRRRQTSSRIANFAEALVSIGWAGTGAVAAMGTWLAVIPGVFVLGIIALVRMASPATRQRRRAANRRWTLAPHCHSADTISWNAVFAATL